MLDFKDITLNDKPLIDGYLNEVTYRNCDFSFANLFCWNHKYRVLYALCEEKLVLRLVCDDGEPCFFTPVGHGNMKKALTEMLDTAKRENFRFRINAATPQAFADIDSAMPSSFRFTLYRDYYEYIYTADSLAHLHGSKLQPKRNHVNQFVKRYPDHAVVPIANDNIDTCRQLYKRWADDLRQRHPDEDLAEEHQSVAIALDNFQQLHLKGCILLVNQQAAAFTYGSPLTSDTFDVMVEKAMPDVIGAYAKINQEMAKSLLPQFQYLNREEDMGIDTLRRAKLSYHPEILLERGAITLKEL